ncbi:hypothetical protein LXA43DRAFT_859379, partial [Ganoderma leucocontextum]
MWLKEYLNFSTSRPVWAYLVDDLFASIVPKDCKPRHADLRINPFLQEWKPKMLSLPSELKGMCSVAKKYGLRLEGLAFARSILRAMPMWDHGMADRHAIHMLSASSRATACLHTKHCARTVGDFENLALNLSDPEHQPSQRCTCNICAQMRSEHGCAHPDDCFRRAGKFLDTLPPRWDPRGEHPEDYESDIMKALIEETTDEEPFDRGVTTMGDLGQVFRIFTDPEKPPQTGKLDTSIDECEARLTIATDGSCLRNGERNAAAGSGVFVEDGHPLNKSLRLPQTIEQSNQTGEIVATLTASQIA